MENQEVVFTLLERYCTGGSKAQEKNTKPEELGHGELCSTIGASNGSSGESSKVIIRQRSGGSRRYREGKWSATLRSTNRSEFVVGLEEISKTQWN